MHIKNEILSPFVRCEVKKGSPKRALTEKENIKLTLKVMKEISILHSLWNNFSHFSSVAHCH